MRPLHRMLVISALACFTTPSLAAQTRADPSGHWEGAVQAPDRQVSIEIDLARNSKGQLAGTFTQAGDSISGFPFASVAQEGRTIQLDLRVDSGGGTFNGTLSADGKTLEGDFTMREGGYVLPFTMRHTGEARITLEPKSAPVGKEFEGAWAGTLDVGGKPVRLTVTLANQSDGTSTGTIISPDASGVAIPVTMTQKGTTLTIEVPSVRASFTGVLNPQGTEIAGTWKQGGGNLPLTLHR